MCEKRKILTSTDFREFFGNDDIRGSLIGFAVAVVLSLVLIAAFLPRISNNARTVIALAVYAVYYFLLRAYRNWRRSGRKEE